MNASVDDVYDCAILTNQTKRIVFFVDIFVFFFLSFIEVAVVVFIVVVFECGGLEHRQIIFIRNIFRRGKTGRETKTVVERGVLCMDRQPHRLGNTAMGQK